MTLSVSHQQFKCLICAIPLGSLTEENRHKHVKNCLDKQFAAPVNSSSKFKLNSKETKPAIACRQASVDEETVMADSIASSSKSDMNDSKEESQSSSSSIGAMEKTSAIESSTSNQSILKYIVADCSICCKVCTTACIRQNHSKKCAQMCHIRTESLIELIKKQQERIEKDLAKGLLPQGVHFVKTKSTSSNTNASKQTKVGIKNRVIKLEQPASKQDEKLQLAIVLSSSLNPIEECSNQVVSSKVKKKGAKDLKALPYLFLDKSHNESIANIEMVNTQSAFLLAELNNQTQESVSIYYTQVNESQITKKILPEMDEIINEEIDIEMTKSKDNDTDDENTYGSKTNHRKSTQLIVIESSLSSSSDIISLNSESQSLASDHKPTKRFTSQLLFDSSSSSCETCTLTNKEEEDEDEKAIIIDETILSDSDEKTLDKVATEVCASKSPRESLLGEYKELAENSCDELNDLELNIDNESSATSNGSDSSRIQENASIVSLSQDQNQLILSNPRKKKSTHHLDEEVISLMERMKRAEGNLIKDNLKISRTSRTTKLLLAMNIEPLSNYIKRVKIGFYFRLRTNLVTNHIIISQLSNFDELDDKCFSKAS